MSKEKINQGVTHFVFDLNIFDDYKKKIGNQVRVNYTDEIEIAFSLIIDVLEKASKKREEYLLEEFMINSYEKLKAAKNGKTAKKILYKIYNHNKKRQ